jgi:hypothetical protein
MAQTRDISSSKVSLASSPRRCGQRSCIVGSLPELSQPSSVVHDRPNFGRVCVLHLTTYELSRRRNDICPDETAIAPGFKKTASGRCCVGSAFRNWSRGFVHRHLSSLHAHEDAGRSRRTGASSRADVVPVLHLATDCRGHREGGRVDLLALQGVRPDVERRTAAPEHSSRLLGALT